MPIMFGRKPTPADPDYVEHVLRALRRTMRLVSLASSVLLVLAAGLLGILLTVSADHAAPRGLDASELSAYRRSVLGVEAALAGLLIVVPLMRRLNDLHLVELVERRHPELYNHLIAAVQFTHQRGLEADTLKALRQRAAQQTHQTRYTRCVPLRGLVVSAMLAVIVGAFFLGYAATASKPVWPSLLRALGNNSIPAPTHTYILSVSPPSGHQVLTGLPVAFEAVIRNAVEPVEVLVSRDAGLTMLADDQLAMRDIGADPARGGARRYVANWPAAASPAGEAVFYVRSGDAQSPAYSLQVLPTPSLQQVQATLTFPVYVAQPDLRLPGGQVNALVGSSVTVLAKSNLPVAQGQVVFDSGLKAPMSVKAGNWIEGRFEVAGDDRYRIQYQTQYEGVGGESVAYAVRAMPDQPPKVQLEPLEGPVDLLPGQKVRLAGQVSDDWGLAKVELVWGQDPGQRRELGGYSPPGLLKGKLSVAVPAEDLGGGTGQRTCWLEARDFRPPDGQVARSDTFQVTLLAPPVPEQPVAAATGESAQPMHLQVVKTPRWEELTATRPPRPEATAEVLTLRQRIAQQVLAKAQRDQVVLAALERRLKEAGWPGANQAASQPAGAGQAPDESRGIRNADQGVQGGSPDKVAGSPPEAASPVGEGSQGGAAPQVPGQQGPPGAGQVPGPSQAGAGGGAAAPIAPAPAGPGGQRTIPDALAGRPEPGLDTGPATQPLATTDTGSPESIQRRLKSIGIIIRMTRQQIIEDTVDREVLEQLNLQVNQLAALVDEYSPLLAELDALLPDRPAAGADETPRVVEATGADGFAIQAPQIPIGQGSGTQELQKDELQGLQDSLRLRVTDEYRDQVNAYFEGISRRPAAATQPGN